MWLSGASDQHATNTVPIPQCSRDFSPRVNFQCRLLYGVCAPPCAVACIYICEHAKDPVVHVRVWWFMETLKHPACTLGWVAQLCCSGFPLERQPKFPMGIIPLGQYNCKKFIEKNVKVIWGLKANCLALDLGLAGIILIVCIRSELPVLLSRHSVGTYREICSRATCQGMFSHSRLRLLGHC